MKLYQLSYNLPKHLIAHTPVEPRDSSKLMVIDREGKHISHHKFSDLKNILSKNDVLVFNQSKVFPARLIGTKDTGGKVEILLLRKISANNTWEAMRKGKIDYGQTLGFGNIQGEVLEVKNNLIKIKFSCRENELFSYMKTNGQTPTPPYIKTNKDNERKIRENYQTVYAKEVGSVAAPTAGLHFTKDLIGQLIKNKVQVEYITLHVGLGTFLPIKEDDITKHPMHEEYFSIENETIERLNSAKNEGKRIIAVGTTTTRVLETLANSKGQLDSKNIKDSTNIFILPPYKFKFVSGLITNFHLPHSTLLALVSAFVSYPNTKDKFKDFESSLIGKGYGEAINSNYRFYSFGDSSLIV